MPLRSPQIGSNNNCKWRFLSGLQQREQPFGIRKVAINGIMINEYGLILQGCGRMGFADLSIKDVAEDHQLSVDEVCQLCDRLQIQYTSPATRLALDDVKAIMELIAHDREQDE